MRAAGPAATNGASPSPIRNRPIVVITARNGSENVIPAVSHAARAARLTARDKPLTGAGYWTCANTGFVNDGMRLVTTGSPSLARSTRTTQNVSAVGVASVTSA